MAEPQFNMESVRTISGALDKLGLNEVNSKLVVIGGAAMAAYGIKSLRSIDLDIAVTPGLLTRLKRDERWQKAGTPGQQILSPEAGLMHVISDGYDGVITQPGDLSAIKMPLDDIYRISTKTLLDEALRPEHSDYSFITPTRILDWKLKLVGSVEYPKHKKNKHLNDVMLISRYLLRTAS